MAYICITENQHHKVITIGTDSSGATAPRE